MVRTMGQITQKPNTEITTGELTGYRLLTAYYKVVSRTWSVCL